MVVASCDGPIFDCDWGFTSMASATVEQTVMAEVNGHIAKCGGGYSAWYVGIAADPRQRLFTDHCVSEKGDAWIFRDCGNDTTARRIEQAFLNAGCKGGDGGGDRNTRFVYAYKITSTTRE
jgi:hypothetical protein